MSSPSGNLASSTEAASNPRPPWVSNQHKRVLLSYEKHKLFVSLGGRKIKTSIIFRASSASHLERQRLSGRESTATCLEVKTRADIS